MDIFVVDRIEGKFAVCEKNGDKIVDLRVEDLPSTVHEGSVLKLCENGKYVEDKAQEEKLREEINALEDELFGDDLFDE